MKATIYLHIGLHKTGTSSIQATLFNSRKKLLAHGINYPHLSKNPNHSVTLLPLFRRAPHRYRANRRAGIDTKEKAAKKNVASLAALRRELDANTSEKVVFSGEGLVALPVEGLRQLRRELEPHAERFRVIAYVRDPYSTANSMFQQRVRRGQTHQQIMEAPPYPHYSNIASSIEVFGRENVDIRLFGRAHFVNGDLIADFLSQIGASPELAKELEVSRTNVALSHEAAYLVHAINQRFPTEERDAPDLDKRAELLRWLAAIPGQPYRCPPDLLQAAQPFIDVELKWLHDVLGKKVFSDRPPAAEDRQYWNEETLAAVALKLYELSTRSTAKDRAKSAVSALGNTLRRLTGTSP